MRLFDTCSPLPFYVGPRVALVALLATAGCQTPIDTTRESAYKGTLGEEIHEIFCQRFASEAYPSDVSGSVTRALCAGEAPPTEDTPGALRGIALERPRLVPALDATFAEETHADLDTLLVDILPLYDEGVLQGQTRALADVLGTLAADDASTRALSRFSHRRGYRPLALGLGVLRPVLVYPELSEVTNESLAALGRGGAAFAPFLSLLRAAAYETATLEPAEPEDGPTTLTLARDLMLTDDAAFANARARIAVRRDARGIALPTGVNGAAVPAPFRDTDGDHLPDVDDLGRFIGAGGAVIALPTPFATEGETGVSRDAAGRALANGGGFVYQYADLDRTFAAGLLRESSNYFAPAAPTLVEIVRALPTALGGSEETTEAYGEAELAYEGFDTEASPLLDLVHALEGLAHRQETVDGLALTETLLTSHEAATSSLVEAMLYGDTRAAATPAARLAQPNIFWDELLAVLERIAQIPGLFERVLRGVDDDRTQDLDEVVALYARNRDVVSFDPANSNAAIPAGPLSNPVQRGQPDSPTNESMLQRSLHLIHDLNGTRYCNKAGARFRLYVTFLGFNLPPITVGGPYEECEFIQIDNVAKAYTEALFGRFELTFGDPLLSALLDLAETFGFGGTIDQLLENQSGIVGLTRKPTPEAMSRLVFAPRSPFLQDIFDDLRATDGVPVEDRHCIGRPAGNRTTPCPNAIIFAWEKPVQLADGHTRTFLDALRPTLLALDDLEPETTTYFGEVSSAIHRHYASRNATRTQRSNVNNPGFSFQDDARSYEPLVADIFDGGRFMHRLRAVVQAADQTTVRPGVDGVDTLAALGELMIDPARNCTGACASGALRTRDNLDYICWNDGRCWNGTPGRPKRNPSPLYLLLDALSNTDRAWATNAAPHTSWLTARSTLVDQFLRTELSGGNRRFKNRRGFAILRTAIPFLRERMEAHRAEGATPARTWAFGLTEDAEDLLGNPLLASIVNLLDAMDADPAARDALLALLDHLLDEQTSPESFDAMVLALTDALSLLEDEEALIPLMNTLSVAFAPNARTSLTSGEALDVEASVAFKTIELLRRIGEADTRFVIPRVLTHAGDFPAEGDQVTRLETILDVIAEVNRTTPREGGAVSPDDVRAIFAAVETFLSSEERGLERLYNVIEGRRLVP